MLQALKTAKKVVGIKQLKKALKEGIAQTVFLAQDADPQLTAPIAALCQANGVACLPYYFILLILCITVYRLLFRFCIQLYRSHGGNFRTVLYFCLLYTSRCV